MQVEHIAKGDMLVKEVGVDGVATLDANWQCNITVPDPAGGAHLIDNQAITLKTADDSAFVAHLTPTQTAALAAGDYVLAVQLKNATTMPEYNREELIYFRVGDQLVS